MAMALSTCFLPGMKNTKSENPFKAHALGSQFRRWSCRQKGGVHPEFYMDAKVYCNGELVMTTGGTQKEYTVDVWSGNHPFYLGTRDGLIVEDDQVEKFRRKYGELSELMKIPIIKGKPILPKKKKADLGKGKNKK